MLDLSYLKGDKLEKLKVSLKNRGYGLELIEKVLELDNKRKEYIKKVDELRAKKNEVSKKISQLKVKNEDVSNLIEEAKQIDNELQLLEDERKIIENEFYYYWSLIPNIPHESVPVGKDSSENKIIRSWGDIPKFDFEPKPHWEIAEKLNIIDFQKGGEIAGSRFVVYKGLGAELEWALINYFREFAKKRGYAEIIPPFLVNERTMFNSGQLPKFKDEMYYIEKDNLYLVPTAEVPLTSLFVDRVLEESELPVYYFAYTPCFRREAGAYGKDVRGIKRMHQFNKVELYKFTLPENSYIEHEKMVEDVEELLKSLNIPYRVVLLCTGDMGFASAKTYDIEVYCVGQKEYLEASSISNVENFQSRRANIKVRRKNGKKEFVHTLNGSGLATPRVLISIIENNQTKEGYIVVPEPLRKYLGLDIIK
ncbi:MAG: serine--tRNA ligase [candidate division WOR-3 bacterium]|nr:serine--tRNA ligase [candidate division WOR-3 bacterium]MDW8150463.1 serine--tRNA ligase [candidate division WOR-3 bacterium]